MRTAGLLAAALFATALSLGLGSNARALPVDVELQLLVDVSGSIDAAEFALQRDGYVNAFHDPGVINAILDTSNGRLGRIAVQFIYWSGAAEQVVVVRPDGLPTNGWMLIDQASDATFFANMIAGYTRPFSGAGALLTAPGSAINFALPRFSNNGFEGSRRVMDISGDGTENAGANSAAARDAALAAGVNAINGLVILNEEPATLGFYQSNVIGGTGSFVVQVQDFAGFQAALTAKLQQEITSTPEPATALLLGLGVLLLGAARRRS